LKQCFNAFDKQSSLLTLNVLRTYAGVFELTVVLYFDGFQPGCAVIIRGQTMSDGAAMITDFILIFDNIFSSSIKSFPCFNITVLIYSGAFITVLPETHWLSITRSN
jgi:hypothetical protein